nr:type IV pilin [uncultured Methanoregula sp.]
MMSHGKSGTEDAVSPVVGVMLMLVVVVIIAAVVSAFAGGMASNSQKAPTNVAIEGTYSQANGMTISHVRGDAVALSKVDFRTTPSELFGADASKFAWNINKTILRSVTGDPVFFNATGFYNTSAFVVGDTLVINHADCVDYVPVGGTAFGKDPNVPPGVNANARVLWDGGSTKTQYFAAYTFGNPTNIGKYFYLDLVDPTGNIINRAKVTITA